MKKDRQHNGQKKKDKQRSTNITHKTKDRLTRTPLKYTKKTLRDVLVCDLIRDVLRNSILILLFF